jgi:hypothetical protein
MRCCAVILFAEAVPPIECVREFTNGIKPKPPSPLYYEAAGTNNTPSDELSKQQANRQETMTPVSPKATPSSPGSGVSHWFQTVPRTSLKGLKAFACHFVTGQSPSPPPSAEPKFLKNHRKLLTETTVPVRISITLTGYMPRSLATRKEIRNESENENQSRTGNLAVR